MKYIVIFFFSLVLFSTAAHAQDYKKHTVQKGETVMSIAKKYKVTPYDIYRLNPDSKNGINENAILLIPAESKAPSVAPVKEQPTKVSNTIHEVKPKETLYSLSKQYDVSVDDIKKANGTALDNGLQIGQQVIIPIKGSGVAAQAEIAQKQAEAKNAPSYMYHVVQAGETKYSIAKQYGMSLQLLEELNPEVKDTLPLGYKLKLDKNALLEKEGLEPAAPVQKTQYITYVVKPKETFYSISKLTGLSEEKIKELNPAAKDGLKVGMELNFPAGTNFNETAPMPIVIKKGSLAATLKKDQPKELALLLPFNLARIESDSLRSQLLRNDKFLNMTLDFYAGALMAIDSAKVLGLPLKVRIMDSKETRNRSDVSSLVSSLRSADAVIGPFFPENAEAAAKLLASEKIPVISPLSKDASQPMENLFQSIPTTDIMRDAMMNYLKSKGGNIIAVIDAKKGSSRDYIKANYPKVKFAGLNADGTIMVDALKGMMVKDSMNYVILDTERIGMVLGTTKALTDALANYQIQLVVLDKYDVFEHDELPLARLTGLKMLYPSVTNDTETPEGMLFSRLYKEQNGAVPNQFAVRGFDVTFDTILRLFQPEEFSKIMEDKASEQVENKFAYRPVKGGNYNTAVYILQYDEGLIVKQVQ